MKIALIGASGFIGSAILKELQFRNYPVRIITRNKENFSHQENIELCEADVMDFKALVKSLKGIDILISAYNSGWSNPKIYQDFIHGSLNIQNAAKEAKVMRFITVGGAGSLYNSDNIQIIDTPSFPAKIYDGANAARDFLTILKNDLELNWTMISPPVGLKLGEYGERTGKYRTGTDYLLVNDKQPAGISAADLAVAIVDEMEKEKYSRSRFTVAY